MKWANIVGVVDDFAPAGTTWNGIPVVKADSLPRGAIVVNCSMSVWPLSAHHRLLSIGGLHVLSYADLTRANPDFPLPAFVKSFRSDYAQHGERWRALGERFADDESGRVLNAVMEYRRTGDYRYMSKFSVRFRDQYFDLPGILSPGEVFVDCGGFDGDTALELLARNKRYKRIHVFEPCSSNFERASERLRDVPNLSLVPLGVSNAPGRLSFDEKAGSASAVASSGATTIEVVTIDDYIKEPVTFIKMDLEGWELAALQGAKRHILDEHPKLAVSVYHRASDFWRIPEYVLEVRQDYDLYLRHYSEGWSETVMYFIPRTRAT